MDNLIETIRTDIIEVVQSKDKARINALHALLNDALDAIDHLYGDSKKTKIALRDILARENVLKTSAIGNKMARNYNDAHGIVGKSTSDKKLALFE